jgi:hypothetical protein
MCATRRTGSVGPLAVLNDTEGQATFILDKKLADVSSDVCPHTLTYTTISLSRLVL